MRDLKNFLLAIVVLFVFEAIPQAAADVLADARDRLAHGEYESAATLYSKHLDSAPPSAAVYFELGQAFQKSDKEAEAALAYRRCLLLDPGFRTATEALQQVNARLGVPPVLSGWRSRVAQSLPLDASTIAGAAIFWLGAFVVLSVYLFHKNRTLILGGGGVLVFVGLALSALVAFADPRISESRQALVMKLAGATLYKVPSEDDSEKITTLNQGSLIKVLNSRGRWLHVELPGGQRGWALSDAITRLVPNT